MISTIDELATDANSSFERSLQPLASSKEITPELLRELESESLVAFKLTALAAKGSDNLDQIASRWGTIYELYNRAYNMLEAIPYQTDHRHVVRVLGLLDQLRQRTRRLHDLHA
jgi:hypothetical protein